MNNPWRQAQYDLLPRNHSVFAFLQHMIASLKPGGNSLLGVVLPKGSLFRKSLEDKIRTVLLKIDKIKDIICDTD